jgi:hypothetical protein
LLVRERIHQSRWEEAAALLQSGNARAALNPYDKLLLTLLLAGQGDWDGAAHNLALVPTYAVGAELLGSLERVSSLALTRDFEAAATVLGQLIPLHGSREVIGPLLVRVEARLWLLSLIAQQKVDTDTLLGLALQHIRLDEPEEAVESAKYALSGAIDAPRQARGWYLLGLAEESRSEKALAMKAYRRAIVAVPGWAPPIWHLLALSSGGLQPGEQTELERTLANIPEESWSLQGSASVPVRALAIFPSGEWSSHGLDELFIWWSPEPLPGQADAGPPIPPVTRVVARNHVTNGTFSAWTRESARLSWPLAGWEQSIGQGRAQVVAEASGSSLRISLSAESATYIACFQPGKAGIAIPTGGCVLMLARMRTGGSGFAQSQCVWHSEAAALERDADGQFLLLSESGSDWERVGALTQSPTDALSCEVRLSYVQGQDAGWFDDIRLYPLAGCDLE